MCVGGGGGVVERDKERDLPREKQANSSMCLYA